MKQHEVQLTYVDGDVRPNPEPVKVANGDRLAFKVIVPEGGEAHIRFEHHEGLSAPEFKHGDPPVAVTGSVSTKYTCDVSLNGQMLKRNAGVPGGTIEPDQGNVQLL